MNKLGKFGMYLYGVGIGGSVLNGIYEENIKLDERKKNGDKYVNGIDYTFHSLGGAFSGFTCGIFWPITAIGRTMVAIDGLITINKNN